jgi:hypothetical protein
MVMEESLRALNAGVDLQGVCLYPVVDIQDWNTDEWAKIGIYDVLDRVRFERRAYQPYVDELRRWQQILGHPEEVSTHDLRTKRLGTVNLQAVKRFAREWEERTHRPERVEPGTDRPDADAKNNREAPDKPVA